MPLSRGVAPVPEEEPVALMPITGSTSMGRK
jgi:hypothetical protein